MTNLPLTYVEDDIQLNLLTINSMILGRDVSTINSNGDDDSYEWTEKQKYVQRCNGNTWKSWIHEYLVALWKKHNLSDKDGTRKVNIGE